jgi:hypothetical protein
MWLLLPLFFLFLLFQCYCFAVHDAMLPNGPPINSYLPAHHLCMTATFAGFSMPS